MVSTPTPRTSRCSARNSEASFFQPGVWGPFSSTFKYAAVDFRFDHPVRKRTQTHPAVDTPTRCSATRHRHSWRRSRSPGSRSKTPWPTAKPPLTTTTAVRPHSMHKVSNGRPWPAIRFLILFRRMLPSAPCRLDRRKYRTGRKVTDEEMQHIHVQRQRFHRMELHHVIRFQANFSHLLILMSLTFVVSIAYGTWRYR